MNPAPHQPVDPRDGGLYVYAIADAPIALTDLTGVGGESLRVVSHGACHAVAGSVSTTPALSAETLHAQDALVRELATRADALLPARFGSRFPDETALRQALEELTPRLVPALARVRGCEQMTIRLFGRPDPQAQDPTGQDPTGHDAAGRDPAGSAPPAPHSPAPDVPPDNPAGAGRIGPGTAYLHRRAAQARQLPAIVDALRACVADIVTAERIERGRPPLIASLRHLIPRGAAEAYHAAVQDSAIALDVTGDAIRLRISGPSPAYAFTEADLP